MWVWRKASFFYSPFKTETKTGNNHVSEISSEGTERVFLDHPANGAELSLSFFVVDLVDELDAAHHRHVGPVGAVLVVVVIGKKNLLEDAFLHGGHLVNVGGSNMVTRHVGAMRGGKAVVPQAVVTAVHGAGVATAIGNAVNASRGPIVFP